MATPSFNNVVIARAAAALYGTQLGSYSMNTALSAANTSSVDAVINSVYARDFGSATNAAVAAMVVNNLGISGALATEATAVVLNTLNGAAAGNKGAAIAGLMNSFAGMSADSNADIAAAATSFNTKIAAATAYAQTNAADVNFGSSTAAPVGGFTVNQDTINGTAGDDVFQARIINNSNTLQSGDVISGGAGNDTLQADIGNSQNFAITAETTGVETVSIRTQANQTDSGQNNPAGVVQIDAQRMVGVNQWESNNSRADLVVEDVRILPNQITSDITIAMVETDPGHVDYGVYFDQYSLRNQTSDTSSISLKIMDTKSVAEGGAPLRDSNYGAFTFTYTQGGTSQVVVLKSQAIQDAQTYPAMVTAFQAALDEAFGAGNASATLGSDFTVVDPVTNTPVTGQTIVLTTKTAAVFSTPAGSGWLADGVAPPTSNFYTDFFTGSTRSSSLVTSTVILDDVGRGSTGGDLVIGGLSVGQTSGSLGVQKFNIEVRDNSKLETINSTNNTLREVVLTNGVTSSGNTAYTTTVKDAGNLTVNGNSGTNGANISNGLSTDAHTGKNTDLPGAAAQQANGFGFSDVRLIDASAMKGKFEFTAEVTSASIGKYLNLKDVQALPAGDNVDFVYTGGANNDTMWVRIDPTVAGSRSTIVSGREDFTFTANGGAGDDSINLGVVDFTNGAMNGGNQAWYVNQKLNKNIFVNGGEGNDTIRTPGAGDVVIDGGAGNDTIYVDNTGSQATSSASGSAASQAAAAYSAAAAAELAQSLAVRTLADKTNAVVTAAVRDDLNTLNLVTPVDFPAAPIAHTTIAAATAAAVATGALTLAQKIALDAAYNVETGGNVVPPTTLVAPAITGNVAVAGNLTAAEFNAGNALLATYIAAAKAAAAEASAADANTITESGLLNATQLAVQNATIALNGIGGAATKLANLNAMASALVLGATDAQVVAALQAAVKNGAILAGDDAALFAQAVATAGTIDATELANMNLLLAPLLNTAINNNTLAQDDLSAALTADLNAVNTAANAASADPVNAPGAFVANDSVGSAEAAAALAAAKASKTAFDNGTLAPLQGISSGLAALKAQLAVGMSDLAFTIATTNAEFEGIISPAVKIALDEATLGVGPGPVLVAGTVVAAEKVAIDQILTAEQVANEITLSRALLISADRAAIVAETQLASDKAAAAAASGGTTLTNAATKAVWVLNTANQLAVNSGYNLVTNDERNLSDLKSDADNSYNMFKTSLTVTFKHLTSTVTVPSTNYRTTDLQMNQAIKDAINNNTVLNKLLVATDGPANTLVITSLIDGVMSNANLSISVALPGSISLSDIDGAAKVYGVSATDTSVYSVMTAAKTSFDTKADYIDQLAETGAVNGNAQISGAASKSTSDNTTTGGAGNDVIVLGTTVGLDAQTSSNDKVVFKADFGNDTVVHFKAGLLSVGGDMLNLSALGGNLLSTAFNLNKSVNVEELSTLVNGTSELVAGLYTDSLTAQTHVYVAVDTTTNIGRVYSVTDAAGVAAGSVTATLAGTIDLADTLWATLTADNFI